MFIMREKKGRDKNMAKKQTAGRDRLGTLAPKFAELNDDVGFLLRVAEGMECFSADSGSIWGGIGNGYFIYQWQSE